jgi:hypothetical protein
MPAANGLELLITLTKKPGVATVGDRAGESQVQQECTTGRRAINRLRQLHLDEVQCVVIRRGSGFGGFGLSQGLAAVRR